MAKQNQSNSIETKVVSVVLLLAVVLLLFGAVIYASPLIFLVLYLINQIAYLSSDKRRKRDFFWLNYGERELFKSSWEDFSAALRTKKYVEAAVERERIRLNQNGQISVRSYRGQDLKAQLDNANYVIGQTAPVIEALENRPQKQRKKGRKHYSNAWGFGLSLLVFLGFVCYGSNTLNVSQIIEQMKSGQTGDAIGAMLWTFVVVKLVFFAIFSIRFRKPPLVSMENVDTYIGDMQEKMKQKDRPGKLTLSDSEEEGNDAVPLVTEKVGGGMEENIVESEAGKSYEETMFGNWAEVLEKDGNSLLGNWNNWENVGQWKNLSVPFSLLGTKVRAAIEYDAGKKLVYFGIAKYDDEDNVSQSLLEDVVFRNIMKINGLTVKNNEWWYCLKYASFDNVFAQYRKLLNDMKNHQN